MEPYAPVPGSHIYPPPSFGSPPYNPAASAYAPAPQPVNYNFLCYRHQEDRKAKTIFSEENLILSANRVAAGILGEAGEADAPAQRVKEDKKGYFHFHYENRPSFFGYIVQNYNQHLPGVNWGASAPRPKLSKEEKVEEAEEQEKQKNDQNARTATYAGGALIAAAVAAGAYFGAMLGNAREDLRHVNEARQRIQAWGNPAHAHSEYIHDVAEDLHMILEGEVKSRWYDVGLAVAALASGALLFLGGRSKNFTMIKSGAYLGGITALTILFRKVYNTFRYNPYRFEAERLQRHTRDLISARNWEVVRNNYRRTERSPFANN